MSTILIVEDEPSIRKLATVNLSARGHEVIEAESAEEGLAQLRKHQPSLIVLDIKLPGMQGWDMLAAMAGDLELRSDIPVIVMTASAVDMTANVRKHSNVVNVLIKPFDIGDLMQAVADALE